ncbi:hypothetical protein LC612_31845 [Nostoc sp. CHAB 5834]|nr:hypothetical protein [Nostoc sp. CHAB 5834]
MSFPSATNCRQYLETISSIGAMVGDFYLGLGRSFEAKPLPEEIQMGEKKKCYKNAGSLVAIDGLEGLHYAEGFAMSPGLIPTHHAWCVTREGYALDPTWPFEPGTEYFGIVLDTQFFEDWLRRTQTWGVLGEMVPKELITSPYTSFVHKEWLPSPGQAAPYLAKLNSILEAKKA